METGKEKEEIIELTEVIEEKPSSSEKREFKERGTGEGEKRHENRPPFPPADPGSSSSDVSFRSGKEKMASHLESRPAGEGEQVIQRLAEDLIPRLTQDRLSPELEKCRAELAALRAQREGLSARFEQWLGKEGVEIVEGISRENISKIAARDLGKEIETVRTEMEKLRSEGETLFRKYEDWFSLEGLKSLDQKAEEAIPRIVREALRPELEKLKGEIEKGRSEAEDLKHRAALWFENEGRQILEGIVRENFPQIAQMVLREEIEKLKKEIEPNENE
jgi:hypothetical protein